MAYPWYSMKEGKTGGNRQFGIKLDENCNTKEIRYRAEFIDHNSKKGKTSFNSTDIAELHNKVQKHLSKMEIVQDGLVNDIVEVFKGYGLLTVNSEEVKKEEPLKETNPDEIVAIKDEGIKTVEINKDININSEAVKSNDSVNVTFKVTRQKESIVIRGYMGKVEEIEAYKIDHHELELYLCKSYKYYSVYEKKTGKRVTELKESRKEVIDRLKWFLENYYDKLKEIINNTIEKDGYISDYEIGTWVRTD